MTRTASKAETARRLETTDLVFCAMFVALIAIGAFIHIMIPLGLFEVTFSLQFLFALLAGFILGKKLGFLSVVVYLIVGLAGVPIYAHGGGLGYLMKPTYGFLIGFAVAAFLAGLLKEKLGRITLPKLIFAAFVGEMAYYACGLIYYYLMFNFVLANGSIGVVELFSVWFLSTVAPDFLLAVLAAVLARKLIPLYERIRAH
ncbi:MAG: biotin transporter BioY [Eubacterium sp.]|nr:biotin transporter BioY [Eubacterium sp.]